MPALPPDNTSRPSTSSNNQNRTTAQPNVKSENGNVQNHVDDAPAGDENNNEDDNAGPPSSRTNKRRLLGVDPSLILSEERSKRTKRTPSPDAEDDIKEGSYDPKDSERAKTLGMQIYQKIMTKKDRDGELMCEPFIKLPSKRQFPDYYETIKVPTSLEMVHERLLSSQYDTLRAVTADLGQIFNNAKRYNVKESLIFQYAKKLHKMVRTFYIESSTAGKVEPESDSEPEHEPTPASHGMQLDQSEELEEDYDMGGPSTSVDGESNAGGAGAAGAGGGGGGIGRGAPGRKRGTYMKDGPTVYKLVKPVLKSIKDAKARDGSGRDIAGIFMELPDRKDFGDYYKTITEPISLQEIEEKMLSRTYQSWEAFFEDVELMCRNAMVYNEDDSEVFKDAQQIKDILDYHRREVHNRLTQPPVQKYRPTKPTNVTPVRVGGNGMVMDQGQYAQSPYGQRASYPPPLPSPSAYPSHMAKSSQPHSMASSPSGGSFLPALPKGVVNEEVIASLPRYPPYEQQAWAASLPPLAVQLYRQMVAASEARKRGLASPTIPSSSTNVLTDLPSSGRPNGAPSFPDRQAPPLPIIKHLEFAFSAAGESADHKQAIRLHNMRGVATHAVVLGLDTTELEITAYIADSSPSPSQSQSQPQSTPEVSAVEALEVVPEVSLRANGNQASLPKFVYEGEKKERPAGMRWTVTVPTFRVETKIEVVATKPGAMAETTAIFITRQY